MFLSKKRKLSAEHKKDPKTKYLSSFKIDSQSVPSHLNSQDLLPATLKYRPESSRPTRGATELTREDRHSAHLRKKRILKVEKVRKDALLKDLAVNNKKLRTRLDKEAALKTLGKSRNVKIIGDGGIKKRKNSKYNNDKNIKNDVKSINYKKK